MEGSNKRVVGSIDEWAAEEVSCSRATFYEVLLNEYKNRIVSLQGSIDADRKYKSVLLPENLRAHLQLSV